ncbi:MAG: HNH endonuclease [Rhodospirillales bacterium]|nr:HNH endonuclease [Rhodospirillales bacterium]
MSLDPVSLARILTLETGLAFSGLEGRDDGESWVEVVPAGEPASHTFSIRTKIGWRDIEVSIRPGAFSGNLIKTMGNADPAGKQAFFSSLQNCVNLGAAVKFRVNGQPYSFDDGSVWETDWDDVELSIRKGHLDLNSENWAEEERLVLFWTSQVAMGIIGLLPLEMTDLGYEQPGLEGFPEGALLKVQANRYERDPRNRAAALAIHGCICKACDQDLSNIYGPIGFGVIEVHHNTPVSELGEGYKIDPAKDLVPLCPNCHAMAHRRKPPFSVSELRLMRDKASKADE